MKPIPIRTKRCPKCKKALPKSQFRSKSARRKPYKIPLRPYCRRCMKIEARIKNRNWQLHWSQEDGSQEGKMCLRCKRQLPASAFNFARGRRDGLRSECKECTRDKKYGLQPGEFAEILELQQGCAVCGTQEGLFRPDHNHKTMELRGVTCHACNVALGLLKDSPANLQSAITYLEGRQWDAIRLLVRESDESWLVPNRKEE